MAKRPAAAEHPSPRTRSIARRRDLLGGAVAAFGGLAAAAWVLRLWNASPRVPFAVGSDSYLTLDAFKNLLHGNWYYTTDLLGAPFGQKLFDYPAPGDVINLLAVKSLGLVTTDPALVMNVFFVMTFPLAALAAYVGFRMLGIDVAIAAALGVAYCILPYHLQRGEGHLFLSAYFAVPLASVVVIRQMSTRTMVRTPRRGVPLRDTLLHRSNLFAVLVAVLVAGTGLYYAFFFVLLTILVGLAVSVRDRALAPIVSAGVLVAIVGAILLVSNIPSVVYRREHGTNPLVAKRMASDSDYYGLRIADLVLPVTGHRIDALAELKAESLGGPVPSEGTEALGIIGAIGYLGLLAVAFGRLLGARRRDREPDPQRTVVGQLAALTLACTVFAAIAGGALVIGVLGFSQIRAWNRISVYLAFFSLGAVGIWLTRLLERRVSAGRPLALVSLAVAMPLALVAVYDQTTPQFTPDYAATSALYGMDQVFVSRTERVLGPSASIFQLPYVPFPENPPVFGMNDYDHLRGYLHSDTLHWSYGGVKGRETEWQPELVAQPTGVAIVGMAAAGFDGLYVNRAGYPDGAEQLESEITPILGPPLFESEDGRLVMFDLRPVRRSLADVLPPARLRRVRSDVLHPTLARFGPGFYGEERDATTAWRWATSDAELVITNPTDEPQTVRVVFGVDSLDPESRVTVSGLGDADTVLATQGPRAQFDRQVTLRPGETRVRFSSDAAPRPAGGADTRDLRFRVIGFQLSSAGLDEAARSVLPVPA